MDAKQKIVHSEIATIKHKWKWKIGNNPTPTHCEV